MIFFCLLTYISERGKDKHVPVELREQWERDRTKKAERKAARAQVRIEDAADPLTPKKGGKKGRKAMMAAAALDPSITLPHRVTDMPSLVKEIRRFVASLGGPHSMTLPPMPKEIRKSVHELAEAFNLKHQSKGHGQARYLTLVKTTRSATMPNEKKAARILRRYATNGFTNGSGKGEVDVRGPKPREGEIVGKVRRVIIRYLLLLNNWRLVSQMAPKIGQSNVGFQMLAAMGWSEGTRIGVSGGLDVPLTAVVKTTKLGLGATRS